jgi:hypothetical protein
MSDNEQLTPQEQQLEQELRLLRPAAARFDLAAHAAAARTARRRRARVWQYAAAAALAGVAVGIVWATRGPRRPDADEQQSPEVFVAGNVLEPPTELAYRRALMSSTAAFDALLDQHAEIARDQDGDEARIGVVKFWRSELPPPSEAL